MAFLQCDNPDCRRYFEGHKAQRFCSVQCREITLRREKRKPYDKWVKKTCANPACGRSFETPRENQKYCCHTCKQAHELAKRLETNGGPQEKACPYCGQKFTGDVRRRYCSDTCKRAAKYRRRRDRRQLPTRKEREACRKLLKLAANNPPKPLRATIPSMYEDSLLTGEELDWLNKPLGVDYD